MSVHMKTPLTEYVTIKTTSPASVVDEIERYFQELGIEYEIINEKDTRIIAKNALFERTPGTMLAGFRYRENLTQEKLSELAGIPRRHISEMENGKRTIGKQNAKKLANALNADYHLFL